MRAYGINNLNKIVDKYFNSVVLLVIASGANGDAAVADVTGKALSVVGNTAIDTSLGYPILTFDGTDDYIESAASQDFALNSVWTIEVSFIAGNNDSTYTKAVVATNNWATAGSGFFIGHYLGKLSISIGSTKITENEFSLGTGENICAVSCDGSNIRVFINGTLIKTVSALTILNDKVLRIADAPSSTNRQNNCKLRFLRMSKGICRYVSSYAPSAVCTEY